MRWKFYALAILTFATVTACAHPLDVAAGRRAADRQILAEICHPAGQAIVEHVLADDLLGEPCRGVRIGEIDGAAVKLTEID